VNLFTPSPNTGVAFKTVLKERLLSFPQIYPLILAPPSKHFFFRLIFFLQLSNGISSLLGFRPSPHNVFWIGLHFFPCYSGVFAQSFPPPPSNGFTYLLILPPTSFVTLSLGLINIVYQLGFPPPPKSTPSCKPLSRGILFKWVCFLFLHSSWFLTAPSLLNRYPGSLFRFYGDLPERFFFDFLSFLLLCFPSSNSLVQFFSI